MEFGNSTGEFPSDAVVYDVVSGLNDVSIAVAMWRVGCVPIVKHVSTSTMTSSNAVDTTPNVPILVHSGQLLCRIVDEMAITYVR